MLKNKSLISFLLCAILFLQVKAQNDTVYGYSEFMEQVKQHHPVVFQAEIINKQGQQTIKQARGSFDPILSGTIDQKYYLDKNYYNQLNSNLQIPTWYGISGNVGYEQNSGIQLNPADFTPNAGLVSAGASIDIGKGLLMNKRMADLKQAKILNKNSELEQKIVLNNLEFEATKAYWNWVKAYNKLIVYKKALINGKEIYNGVVMSYFQGDKPAIDTVEAGVNYQNIQLKLNEVSVDYKNQTQYLETFLWQQGNVPLALDTNIKPPIFFTAQDTVKLYNILFVDSVVAIHPELEVYKNKQAVFNIDLRLKRESLRPELQLKYNLLNEPINSQAINTFSMNDYKFGAKLSYPIFNRTARADVRLSKLKIEDIELGYSNKKREITFKINNAINMVNNLQQQVVIGNKNVNNYESIYTAEKTLFEIGESSIFMVNNRFNSYILSQIYLIDLLYTNEIVKQKLIYETYINK